MKSYNHQFMELHDKAIKRYVRTTVYPVGGRRLNPRNKDNPFDTIEFILATPETNYKFYEYTTDTPTKVEQTTFTYDDEVLELYSEDEIRAFKRLNQALFEEGVLVEYNEVAPDVKLGNSLSSVDVKKIVSLKTKPAFKGRIDDIDSLHTLQLILAALEDSDAPMSYAKIVRERMNGLN